MDRSAQRQPALSALQLANMFMSLKTNLYLHIFRLSSTLWCHLLSVLQYVLLKDYYNKLYILDFRLHSSRKQIVLSSDAPLYFGRDSTCSVLGVPSQLALVGARFTSHERTARAQHLCSQLFNTLLTTQFDLIFLQHHQKPTSTPWRALMLHSAKKDTTPSQFICGPVPLLHVDRWCF